MKHARRLRAGFLLSASWLCLAALLNPAEAQETCLGDKCAAAGSIYRTIKNLTVSGTVTASQIVGPGGGSAATNGVNNDILTSNGLLGFGTPITPGGGVATFLRTPSSNVLASWLATGAAASNLGSAGGDLSGTFPSPTVAQIQGRAFPAGATTNGQIAIGSTTDGNWHLGTITAGANVTVTNTPGGISIASSGGGGGVITNGSANDILISDGLGGFGTPLTPGANVAALLGAFNSSNLLTALTTKTGTGLAVFGTSPILVTPNLGIPSAVVLTNASNVPMGAAAGTLLPAHGGTGQTAWTDGDLAIGNTATGGLSKAKITAGANVTVTNGNGSVTIAATTGSATAGGSNGQYQINSGGALAGRGLGTGLADNGTNLILTSTVNDQTAGAYPVVAGDAQKTVLVGAFTYTLPQAGSAGFESGWDACFLNTAAGNATVNTTTSLFKGAGGATSMTIRPKAWACPSSDGTNYQTVFGSTDGGDLTAATVTNAKLANMNAHTYKGNNTGSPATPLDLTQAQVLTDLFDPLGSAQGTVYFRGAAGLIALAPGTNGQVFTTAGASADPSWTTVAGTGNMVGSAATTSGNLLQSNNTGGTLTTATDSGIAASALLTATSTNTLSNKTIDCTTSTCTNFPRSLNWGWIPTYNPNEDTIYTADGAVTVLSIRGTVVAPIGASGFVQFNKASDTKACNDASSVNLATTTFSFDANGAANTNQTLTLIGSPVLSAGDRICALTNGTGWTTGAGHAGITIRLRAS